MAEYSISQLAKEFDVTTRTIRHYEDLGLLAPARRGQTRVYSPADRTRLRLILRGKRLGLSLDDSREIIDMYEPGKSNVDQLKKLIDTIRHSAANSTSSWTISASYSKTSTRRKLTVLRPLNPTEKTKL